MICPFCNEYHELVGSVEESWHSRAAKELKSTLKNHHVVYHTHLHETQAERHTYETKTGKTAIQSLYDAGNFRELIKLFRDRYLCIDRYYGFTFRCVYCTCHLRVIQIMSHVRVRSLALFFRRTE